MPRPYSKTTQTTYLIGLHTLIPNDAVEISDDLYLSVIGNPTEGRVRSHDERGFPYLIDAPEAVPDFVAHERVWRDSELFSVMWLRERHRDQVELSEQTTLTAEEYAEVLVYLQLLRDWPQSSDFPDSEHRPIAPSWIANQAK